MKIVDELSTSSMGLRVAWQLVNQNIWLLQF